MPLVVYILSMSYIPKMEAQEVQFSGIREETSLQALYAGWHRCPRGHKWGGVRESFLMHYVLSGQGTLRTETGEFALGPGGIFLIFPGQRTLYQAELQNPWHYTWVGFAGRSAQPLLAEAGLTPASPVLKSNPDARLKRHFQDLVGELSQLGRGCGLRADAHLCLILARLGEVGPQGGGMSLPVRERQALYVREAARFIEINFQNPITVTGVSRHTGLDRAYFSRLFRRQTGMTLQAYLVRCRMEKARELLGGGLSVAQAANSVGYADGAAFARAFKRYWGSAPGSHRRSEPGDATLAG